MKRVSTNTLLLVCIVAISAFIVFIISEMYEAINMYEAILDEKTVSAEETIGADEGSQQYLGTANNEQTIRSTQEFRARYANLLLRCILSFAAMVVSTIGAVVVVFKGKFFSRM